MWDGLESVPGRGRLISILYYPQEAIHVLPAMRRTKQAGTEILPQLRAIAGFCAARARGENCATSAERRSVFNGRYSSRGILADRFCRFHIRGRALHWGRFAA